MFIESPAAITTLKRLSVFIDGDNIPSRQAEIIRVMAHRAGHPNFFRIYGNDCTDPGWRQVPGMRMMVAGQAKNAADILLTVEAMDRFMKGAMDVILLASSDGDFSHLAVHLKEAGLHVMGVGTQKAPEAFRAACSEFKVIAESGAARLELDRTDFKAHQLIARESEPQAGMPISVFGERMNTLHRVTCKDIPEASWTKYFLARKDRYDVDGAATPARVRIRCREFSLTR